MINSVTLFLVRELRQTFIFFLPCHCISPARSCLRSSRPLTFPLGIEASFRSCVTHNTRAWKNEREGRIVVVVVVVVARFTLGGGDSGSASLLPKRSVRVVSRLSRAKKFSRECVVDRGGGRGNYYRVIAPRETNKRVGSLARSLACLMSARW